MHGHRSKGIDLQSKRARKPARNAAAGGGGGNCAKESMRYRRAEQRLQLIIVFGHLLSGC